MVCTVKGHRIHVEMSASIMSITNRKHKISILFQYKRYTCKHIEDDYAMALVFLQYFFFNCTCIFTYVRQQCTCLCWQEDVNLGSRFSCVQRTLALKKDLFLWCRKWPILNPLLQRYEVQSRSNKRKMSRKQKTSQCTVLLLVQRYCVTYFMFNAKHTRIIIIIDTVALSQVLGTQLLCL